MSDRDRATVLSGINNGHGRQSSTRIFSLPPEIMSAIFEYGKDIVDLNPLPKEGNTPPKMAFEWMVSRTCKIFRAVATRTPRLWTSLQFNGSSSLRWNEECIARSRSCLLDILIEDGDGYSMTQAAINILTRHSIRWRSLSLRCRYESLQNAIVSRICSFPAPALRYLSLQVNDVENVNRAIADEDLTSPHIFRDGTPLLKFLRLAGWATCLFRPPLETIVTLHFDDIGQPAIQYSTLRRILTSSPFLEHLSFYGDVIGGLLWPGRSDIIVLRNLRSLRICGVNGKVYPGILLGIDAPLLESLTLKDLEDRDLDGLWDLSDKSRFSNLTQLIFSDSDLSTASYTRLFNTFHDITSFSISNISIDRTPLTDLLCNGVVVGKTPPYFPWPKLRDVEFSFGNTNHEERIIHQLAKTRRAHGYPLSRILLRLKEGVPEEFPELEMESQTIYAFVDGDVLWPQSRTYIDYDDERFIQYPGD